MDDYVIFVSGIIPQVYSCNTLETVGLIMQKSLAAGLAVTIVPCIPRVE